jgi:hypothetical protein
LAEILQTNFASGRDPSSRGAAFLATTATYQGIDFNRSVVTLSEQTVVKGSYVATNAFGGQVQVTSQKTNIVGITLSPDAGPFERVQKPSVSLSMVPEMARSLKEKAQILFVADPGAPFVSRRTYESRATFDVPYETEYEYITLTAKPLCVALIDPTAPRLLRMLEHPSK